MSRGRLRGTSHGFQLEFRCILYSCEEDVLLLFSIQWGGIDFEKDEEEGEERKFQNENEF